MVLACRGPGSRRGAVQRGRVLHGGPRHQPRRKARHRVVPEGCCAGAVLCCCLVLLTHPQGFSPAQYNLALCIDRGLGTQADEKRAYSWLKLAAEQGDAEAQTSLALRLFEGRGVLRSEREAAEWYRRAAASGSSRAMLGLSHCYQEGRGVCPHACLPLIK